MEIIEELSKLGFQEAKRIGNGGYGTIYTVEWDKYEKKTFVAKVIYKVNEKSKISFESEKNTLEYLFDDNIIKLYQSIEKETFYLLIYEFCSNKTLHDLVLSKNKLNKDEFKIIAKQIIKAIHKCHQKNIVHRDIKPGNIFIDENNRMKLGDFGLSKIISKGNLINNYAGSLNFMAPEIFLKTPYDPYKADIWALGITFYFMITGNFPFLSDYYHNVDFAIKHQDVIFPFGLSNKIMTLIKQMLNKDPSKRPTIDQILQNVLFQNSSLPPLFRNKSDPIIHLNKKKLAISNVLVSKSIKYLNPLNLNLKLKF